MILVNCKSRTLLPILQTGPPYIAEMRILFVVVDIFCQIWIEIRLDRTEQFLPEYIDYIFYDQ
jgi:hypothetical protein